MHILFINPSFSKTDFETPLGLLYLARACRQAGHRTKVLDLTFGYGVAHVAAYLASTPCDAVCIYAMSPMVPMAFTLARLVKQRDPRTIVLTGGPHPTMFPQEMLVSDDVDAVVMGEGENTVPELLSVLGQGTSGCAAVKGIAWKDHRDIVVNPRRELIKDLDVLAFPDRADLDTLAGYMHLAGIKIAFGRRMLNLIASRGCSFNCAFCQPALSQVHGGQVRFRSAENVVGEIEFLRERWGVQTVWFEDDTFTCNKEWLSAFCKVMRQAATQVSWSCNSRLDLVNEEMLRMMRGAGCELVRYGLESGSQEVLDRDFQKGIRLENIKHIFSLTRSVGLRTYVYAMVGGSHETVGSIEETRHFLRLIKPDFVQIAITTPMPGTRLWQAMREDKNLTIRSSRYEDIRLFEKCNYDTLALSAQDVERLYVSLFNEFHFFSLRALWGRHTAQWIKSNVLFAWFLMRVPQPGQLRFTVRLAWSYVMLMLRLVMRSIPLFRSIEKKVFTRRLSFPEGSIWNEQ